MNPTKGSIELELVKATLEKHKHSPLLLELPKSKKLKKQPKIQREVITISEEKEGMQTGDLKDRKQYQGGGGRRSTRLAKVASQDRKGKQKVIVHEEEELEVEEFEAQVDEESDGTEFEDTTQDMGEEETGEENEDNEEETETEDVQKNEALTTP